MYTSEIAPAEAAIISLRIFGRYSDMKSFSSKQKSATDTVRSINNMSHKDGSLQTIATTWLLLLIDDIDFEHVLLCSLSGALLGDSIARSILFWIGVIFLWRKVFFDVNIFCGSDVVEYLIVVSGFGCEAMYSVCVMDISS